MHAHLSLTVKNALTFGLPELSENPDEVVS